ncbi:MAG: succinate dehydrogenase, hydrophobic membrane anchor protein [Gammaproteobacteria bacterium]|nr:succinate dehydrogenase, hydrophobic membrane anchor protein [Gammaproteobacteria bacterium]MBU1654516.1 succinate dehydrogenase, hydrophobic membrane anchor protein [Gammaproteobacteria bacterium]MBU1962673.1 succinate dehydrogenase, hydrophobic membrane anchor protein [Gammaproteobacteria bacterium]
MSRSASGLRAWLLQRLTALYLAGFFIYLILYFHFSPPKDYGAWIAWVDDPLNGVALLLFIATALLHAWVGVRDILFDYVPLFPLRLALLGLVGFALVACGFWSLRIILVPLLVRIW